MAVDVLHPVLKHVFRYKHAPHKDLAGSIGTAWQRITLLTLVSPDTKLAVKTALQKHCTAVCAHALPTLPPHLSKNCLKQHCLTTCVKIQARTHTRHATLSASNPKEKKCSAVLSTHCPLKWNEPDRQRVRYEPGRSQEHVFPARPQHTEQLPFYPQLRTHFLVD